MVSLKSKLIQTCGTNAQLLSLVRNYFKHGLADDTLSRVCRSGSFLDLFEVVKVSLEADNWLDLALLHPALDIGEVLSVGVHKNVLVLSIIPLGLETEEGIGAVEEELDSEGNGRLVRVQLHALGVLHGGARRHGGDADDERGLGDHEREKL